MSEEQTTRYHVKRREFLNEDEAMPAYVIGIVQDTRNLPDTDERWKYGTAILDFGDCYHRISFNLDMTNEYERANALRKINLIAEVVNAVRDGIEKEVESRNARPYKTDSQPNIAISNASN